MFPTLAYPSGDESGYIPRQHISLDNIFCLQGLEERYYADEQQDSGSPLQTPPSLESPGASDGDNVNTQHHEEPALHRHPATGRQCAGSAASAAPNFLLRQAVFMPTSAWDIQPLKPQQTFTTGGATVQQAGHSRNHPPVHLPPGPHLPQATTLPMTTSATAKMLPLFHGDYSDKDEPAHWFTQFQLALPDTWSEAAKLQRFQMQLAPGGYADEWFNELSVSE